MSLLGWLGPADAVPWIAGDDSCVGDAGTVLSDCDAGASDFDDGSAYGMARLVLKDDGVSGADIQVTVALVSVGVAGRRIVLPQMLGQSLLVAEGPAYRSAVASTLAFCLDRPLLGCSRRTRLGRLSMVWKSRPCRAAS